MTTEHLSNPSTVPEPFERLSPYISQALGLSERALATAYRPACEADLDQILAFRQQVNGSIWWDDRSFVRWRYFSRRTDSGEVPYWVFVRDGEVLGGCGLEPITLVIDGRPVSAVRTLDIMVRPDIDGLGLGVFMNLELFRHFPITLVTGSNQRSHHLLMRMFHHATDLRFWKIATRSRALIEQKLGLGPTTHMVASAMDLLLGAWRRQRRIETPAGISIRELAAFDSQVIELSGRHERAGRVLVRRTDEYLNWRFVKNPRCQHRILGAFDGNGMIGYVVTRFNKARPNHRREAEIVDWLAAPDSREEGGILPLLIQAGTDALIHDGAGIVSCAAAGGEVAEAMEATGFHFRPSERLPFFVRAADPSVHQRLTAGESWFLTRGDIDLD